MVSGGMDGAMKTGMLSNIATGNHFNIYTRSGRRWQYLTWRRTRETAERYARKVSSPGYSMIREIVDGRLARTDVVDEAKWKQQMAEAYLP